MKKYHTSKTHKPSPHKKPASKIATFEQCMRFAANHIVRFGDTDIFPYPIERQVIRDEIEDVVQLLTTIHKNFLDNVRDMPVESERLLQAVGYTGFRQGTQIDPIWNTYLLGLLTHIGPDIEAARVPATKDIVFSYRFKPDQKNFAIFSKDYGWTTFQKRAVALARNFKYVLTCDISDFYPRIYHHRLENALKKATINTQAITQINKILSELSRGASYGLPVGGPAARLLSELLLNRVDRLLITRNIAFCRFVDDYHIFAHTKEEAYSSLIFLCESLLENEGLTLQKTKTRIMSAAEFLESSSFSDEGRGEDEEEVVKRNFLTLHIHYDPYSDTAADDYETLKKELRKFDIVGMLAAEMQKARIAESLTRKLVRAIRHLSAPLRDSAISSLMDNLPTLYPIFPTVMMVVRDVLTAISSKTRIKVFAAIRTLVAQDSYLCEVPVNLAFALRVLAHDNSEETDAALMKLHGKSASALIRRDIVLILAQHNADYWISAQLKRFSSCTTWEQRALLVASYILEDEGEHWRRRVKTTLSPFDQLIMKWSGKRKQAGRGIEL